MEYMESGSLKGNFHDDIENLCCNVIVRLQSVAVEEMKRNVYLEKGLFINPVLKRVNSCILCFQMCFAAVA
jgi:hypothetical protein